MISCLYVCVHYCVVLLCMEAIRRRGICLVVLFVCVCVVCEYTDKGRVGGRTFLALLPPHLFGTPLLLLYVSLSTLRAPSLCIIGGNTFVYVLCIHVWEG